MLNPLHRGYRRLLATLFLTASLSIVGCTDDNGATTSTPEPNPGTTDTVEGGAELVGPYDGIYTVSSSPMAFRALLEFCILRTVNLTETSPISLTRSSLSPVI